jgi:1,4-dihydroxy-2-naphthoate polyprenyltransferase
MHQVKASLGPMRLPFVILTPACVALGLATAVWQTGHLNVLRFALVLVGATAAHISVNAFNEYFDFRSGLDSVTKRTPFSGGSGTLPTNPGMAPRALAVALVAFGLTGLIGVYLLRVGGGLLLPLGILGLVIIPAYTPLFTRNPIVCLITPGLGFGPLMVMGTHFVLAGSYSWTAFIASLVPFFLVNDLLLLNQFPDVEADRSVGRRHLPIVFGRRASSLVYGAFLLLAFLSIVAGVRLGYLPTTSLIGLVSVTMAVPAFVGAYRHADSPQELVPSMGLNVIVNIATPILLAVGLLVT